MDVFRLAALQEQGLAVISAIHCEFVLPVVLLEQFRWRSSSWCCPIYLHWHSQKSRPLDI